MSEPFLLIAGHSALDFLNTEKANSVGERVELLTGPTSVADWGTAAGFRDVGTRCDESLLNDARHLRGTIRALVVAWTVEEDAPAAPLAALNAILATGASRNVLYADFAGGAEPITAAPHPLLPIAVAAFDLLTRHDKSLVRRCAGTGCVLWFLDTTKNKRRRWCRMEACGNREKASAHYHRHHSNTTA